MPRKYYKVVRFDTFGALKSVVIGNPLSAGYLPNIEVEYKVGEWAEPTLKHSKLMAFDSFKAASCFADNDFGSVVFECSVKNPRKIKRFYNVFLTGFSHLVKFWKDRKAKKRSIVGAAIKDRPWKIQVAPKGTIVCDAIKLEGEPKNRGL